MDGTIVDRGTDGIGGTIHGTDGTDGMIHGVIASGGIGMDGLIGTTITTIMIHGGLHMLIDPMPEIVTEGQP